MFAILDGLKTRVGNLTARHEAVVDVPRPALGRRRRIVRERRPAVSQRAHAAVPAVLRLAHGGAGGSR